MAETEAEPKSIARGYTKRGWLLVLLSVICAGGAGLVFAEFEDRSQAGGGDDIHFAGMAIAAVLVAIAAAFYWIAMRTRDHVLEDGRVVPHHAMRQRSANAPGDQEDR